MTVDADKGEHSGGWDILAGLLSPLRLPERVVVAIEGIAEQLEDLGPMREEVEAIRHQSNNLSALLPALSTIKEDLSVRLDRLHECIIELEAIEAGLDKRVARLCEEITAMQPNGWCAQGRCRAHHRAPTRRERAGAARESAWCPHRGGD